MTHFHGLNSNLRLIACAAVLLLTLVACSQGQPPQEETLQEGRELPVTEILSTENEKDLRLINALLNPDFSETQENWDKVAFIQGAQDMRAHGSSTAAMSTFLGARQVISREEFLRAYSEIRENKAC